MNLSGDTPGDRADWMGAKEIKTGRGVFTILLGTFGGDLFNEAMSFEWCVSAQHFVRLLSSSELFHLR